MLTTTIDLEIRKHLSKVENDLFADYTIGANLLLAEKSNGCITSDIEDPIYRADTFYTLVRDQYATALNSLAEDIKTLFIKSGILFRLYDIHGVYHKYHTITLTWTLDKTEYGFTCRFDSSPNPLKSIYRLGALASCGEFVKGDLLHGTLRTFMDDRILPAWFVNPLRTNS